MARSHDSAQLDRVSRFPPSASPTRMTNERGAHGCDFAAALGHVAGHGQELPVVPFGGASDLHVGRHRGERRGRNLACPPAPPRADDRLQHRRPAMGPAIGRGSDTGRVGRHARPVARHKLDGGGLARVGPRDAGRPPVSRARRDLGPPPPSTRRRASVRESHERASKAPAD